MSTAKRSFNAQIFTMLKNAQYNGTAMFRSVLEKIEKALDNARPKIIFGPLGIEERKELFANLKGLVLSKYPDAEVAFVGKEHLSDPFSSNKPTGSHRCLLIDDIFNRNDFTVMINQAFGDKGTLLIGVSTFDVSAVDYAKMTTIAARFDSFYPSGRSFSDIPFDLSFMEYLTKGNSLFGDGDYLGSALSNIESAMGLRKPGILRGFFDFILKKSGEACSERKLSSDSPLPLSPNTVGKYLGIFATNFLIYRLEGFDFVKMRKISNNFRLYPFDPSACGLSQRDAAVNVDMLAMVPLIGKAKEEGYDCFFAYFHRQRSFGKGKRRYFDEVVGLYASNGIRHLVFSLNLSGNNGIINGLIQVPQTFEKYLVAGGSFSKERDARGFYHVGIEHLLGEDFDWGMFDA